MHLRSLLHGVNSMYGLTINNNRMGIVTVTVNDNTNKLRIASTYVNWKLTWQRFLGKELGARYMIELCGALEPQKNHPN